MTTEIEHADTVDRHLATRELDGADAVVATIGRRFPTSPEDLWDAVTNAERLRRWFAPVSGDLRLGGRYQVEGNASGEILTCDPPHSFRATWEFGEGIGWITVMISGTDDGGAHLSLEHTAHIPSEFWDQFGPGATGVGWDLSLLGMAQHLANPEADKPDENEWVASEAGRAFITASSQHWVEASVTFGTNRDQAEAAGRRTTAFYTGTEA